MNKELAIGHRLKQLRIERKLTQKEVSCKINLGINTVRCNEKGMVPNTPQLCKYADFYGVSVDYLLCRTDAKNYNKEYVEQLKQEIDYYENMVNEMYKRGRKL